MTMSSRIAVMDAGRIVQVGTPAEIYEHPRSRFVAGFIGLVNLLEGRVEGSADGLITVRSDALPAPLAVADAGDWARGSAVAVAVRPEKIVISRTPPAATANVAAGVVRDIAYLGDLSIYHVHLDNGFVLKVAKTNVSRQIEPPIDWDDKVYLSWTPDAGVILKS